MSASTPQTSKTGVPVASGQALRVGQVYLDVQQQLLHCLNDTAQQLLEEGVPFTSADLARQPLQTPEGKSVDKSEMPLLRSWRENEPVEAVFLWPREQAPPLQLRWIASPIRGKSGQVAGILGTIVAGPLEPDWQVLAGLSHDLRTPLQSLGLLVELAESAKDDPTELSELLSRIRTAAGRSMSIAQELLDWCRGPLPKSGRRGERDWVALEPFLTNLAAEQQVAARNKSLALVSNVAATHGWEAHTDRVRLGRLLSNLLVNAIRYTTTGQVEFTASWRDERNPRNGSPPGRKLALSIVDTGAGISMEEQESIFQPFERGRAGKEGDSGGSGLGLAVVDRLVEELGLELEVYSEYGRGSAFHLLLPGTSLRATEATLSDDNHA
jgi:signal transduction histidine kinase